MALTKQQILDSTHGGLDILVRLIPDLPNPPDKKKLFRSVFREESTPSANIYRGKNGVWYYKDFGDNETALNAIDFVAKLKNIPFKEALKYCADVHNIDVPTFERPEPVPDVVIYPKEDECKAVLENQTSAFHKYCTSKLNIAPEHLVKWNVGSELVKFLNAETNTWEFEKEIRTSFVFQNKQGLFLNRKRMLYGENGKRVRDFYPKSLTSKIKGEVFSFCPFGEHLFDEHPDKPVVLVESEKSAVIASYFYPGFRWLATRGQSSASSQELENLDLNSGIPVLVLADADKERKVPISFLRLVALNANVHLIDLMPEREDKSDIADFIAEGLRPEIIVPKTKSSINKDTGEVTYTPSYPDWNVVKKESGQFNSGFGSLGGYIDGYKVTVYKKNQSEKEEDDDDDDDPINFIPIEAFAEEGNDPKKDYEEYGFYQYKNQYWKFTGWASRKGPSSEAFTNFTLRVLFHIESGRTSRRLVELVNVKGIRKILDAETKQLTSLGTFKEFVESAGNFIFMGTAADHQRIKQKLYADEVPCIQVDVLGQHGDGFFSFSNGIYHNSSWLPVDDRGIISLNDKAYYIPCGNKTYNNNPSLFSNEKKVVHNPRPITFEEWATLHKKVFGNASMPAILFGVACLFSDIVFAKYNFFPLLFLYGEGGSGKGELIRSVQYLFGKPQDPLHLSSDANTDKAKIRELAQFRNLVICLEEYRNGNDKTINMLKGLWDRFGYKRSVMDSSYRTETVPISSGVMVTGNDYPTDDPLLQRLIVLELNKNQRSNEQVDAFYRLKEYQETGITSITLQLLNERQRVEEQFRDQYQLSLKELRELFKTNEVNVTDRMVGNVAVMDAMYSTLAAVIPFPFVRDDFRGYMVESMKSQAAKRDTGSEIQRFWDCLAYSANKREVVLGTHYWISGNRLCIQFGSLHAQYLITHKQMYSQAGLAKQTLLDKIKGSEAYVEYKDSMRLGTVRSSAHVFNTEKLSGEVIVALLQKGAVNPEEGEQEQNDEPF